MMVRKIENIHFLRKGCFKLNYKDWQSWKWKEKSFWIIRETKPMLSEPYTVASRNVERAINVNVSNLARIKWSTSWIRKDRMGRHLEVLTYCFESKEQLKFYTCLPTRRKNKALMHSTYPTGEAPKKDLLPNRSKLVVCMSLPLPKKPFGKVKNQTLLLI